MQHGRGVALADFNRDGKTDIVYGNWNGPHRLFLQLSNNRKQRFKVQVLKTLFSNYFSCNGSKKGFTAVLASSETLTLYT